MRDSAVSSYGGYRKLISFQIARVVYDVTVRFCDRYVERTSRTPDQMVQAARSGVQNIAEGSNSGGVSRRSELRLTAVARASLEELRLDYEDFLRHRRLELWARDDDRRTRLIGTRPASADDVAEWAKACRRSDGSRYEEIVPNGTLALIAVTCSLLDRQIAAQAATLEREGDLADRLRRRKSVRSKTNDEERGARP